MRISVILLAWLGVVGAGAGWFLLHQARPAAASPTAPRPRIPVVVELFSSEGCSSCPPADGYLAALDRAQPIDGVTVLALEEHVDYWDRLGWSDPFAAAQFSDRQRDYARVLADHHVFTPEIVVGGHLVMPGGDEDEARAMMEQSAREAKARVTVRREGGRITVDVSDVPASSPEDPPEVWLALTESGLTTDVPAGENAGRRLVHAPVVRRLRSLGRVSGGAFHTEATVDVEPSWKMGALRTVAFVQLAGSRKIVGAGAI